MSLQCYALSRVFYASCTNDFHLQTLPSMMQLKRLLMRDHDVIILEGCAELVSLP
jgi:hypothetical protein